MVNLRKNAAGNLVKIPGNLGLGKCTDCLDCGHCEDCSSPADCPEGCCTPAIWRVTFSGVEATIPGGCTVCWVSGTSASAPTHPTIDTLHYLTQTGECEWKKSFGTVTISAYHSEEDCTEPEGGEPCVYSGPLVITLTRTTTTNYSLKALASLDLVSGHPSCTLFNSVYFFTDTTATATAERCDQDASFANEQSAIVCNVLGTHYMSTSGTASASPCRSS